MFDVKVHDVVCSKYILDWIGLLDRFSFLIVLKVHLKSEVSEKNLLNEIFQFLIVLAHFAFKLKVNQ